MSTYLQSARNTQYATTRDNYFNRNNRQQDGKLWQPSPSSMNYVSPQISFSRQERFKLNSIYNLTQSKNTTQLNKNRSTIDYMAKELSKRIDQEEKNQVRIKRKFSINNDKQKGGGKMLSENKMLKYHQNGSFLLDRRTMQITKRLTSPSPKKQSLLRDRHGGRSNLIMGEDNHLQQLVKNEIERFSNTSPRKSGSKIMGKTITVSKRLNFNLPDNYYPGAGTYQIKRYLQQLDDFDNKLSKGAATYTAREKDQVNQH